MAWHYVMSCRASNLERQCFLAHLSCLLTWCLLYMLSVRCRRCSISCFSPRCYVYGLWEANCISYIVPIGSWRGIQRVMFCEELKESSIRWYWSVTLKWTRNCIYVFVVGVTNVVMTGLWPTRRVLRWLNYIDSRGKLGVIFEKKWSQWIYMVLSDDDECVNDHCWIDLHSNITLLS